MKALYKKAAAAAVILLLSAAGAASAVEKNCTLVVGSTMGKTGDTVEVAIAVEGLSCTKGIKGLSGGKLALVYDSARAKIRKVVPGEAVSGFEFVSNLHLTDNSIKVAWASGNRLIAEDGVICRVTFTMKQEGRLQPTLKEPLLFDQEVAPLQVSVVRPILEEEPPAGGEKRAKNSATRYRPGPPDLTESFPVEKDPRQPDCKEKRPPVFFVTEDGVNAPARADDKGTGPEALPEKRAGQKTLWRLLLCGAAFIGLAGYLVLRKRRQI